MVVDKAGFRVIGIIAFVVCLIIFVGVALMNQLSQPSGSPQQAPPSLAEKGEGFGAAHSEHTRTKDGQAVSGFSNGPGFSITWQSITAPAGATPLDVLEAVQSRLQHMQKTNQGGDEIARAIWEVNKAVEILSGTGLEEKPSSGAGFIPPPGK